MKTDYSKLSLETRREADEYLRIGNAAVQKAREENRRLGLPNSFCIGDVIYYELPNGDVMKKSDYDAAEAAKAANKSPE